MASDALSEDRLSEIISGLEEKIKRGEADQIDITRAEQLSQELFHKARMGSAEKNLAAIVNQKTEKVISADDPEEILNFTEYIGNYTVGRQSAQIRTTDRLSNKEHDRIREEIKQLIYGYYDAHLNMPRINITTKDLFENIPKLRKLTRDSEHSLSAYLRPIRKEPDSRIKDYERKTKTYKISLAVNYNNVVHAAERVFESKGYVTTVEIAQELIVEKEHHKGIGNHLARWANGRNLDNEEVSMGRKIGQCMAYFRKDERPPITPTERVRDTIKNLENVTLDYIMEKTGLGRKSISTIMTTQHYSQFKTEEEGIVYTKQTKG